MRHLYLLVIVLVALTNPLHSSAQNPNAIAWPASAGNCDGNIQFINSGVFAPNWTWNWYDEDTTLISTGTHQINNLCPGNYMLVLDSGNVQLIENITVAGCPLLTFNSTVTNCTPGNCDGTVDVVVSGATGGITYSIDSSPQQVSPFFAGLCPGSHFIECWDAIGCSSYLAIIITDPSITPLVANVTTTNDNTFSCSGTASAAPTGGAGSYIYLWSTGETTSSISNLCVGSYYVVVQDANQDTASFSFTITNPCSNLTLAVNTTDCTPGNCDGSVTFLPTGGSAPYTYSIGGAPQSPISPITNLCAGSYTATCMDANGCTATAPVTITDPCSSMALSASVTHVTTPGGSDGIIELTVSGGASPYQYSISGGPWGSSPAFYGLSIGTYQLYCEDNLGCTATVIATVLDSSYMTPIIPNLTYSDDLNGSCTGSASVAPTGGTAPYNYLWSTGETTSSVSGLCQGNYWVTIWYNMGTDSITQNFTILNPCMNFSAYTSAGLASNPTSCDGSASASPVNGTAPYTYLWSNGQTTASIDNLCSGTYTVFCEDANGCGATFTVFIYDSIGTIGNLSASVIATDDLSNNCTGSAYVSLSGGVAPYTIAWSNGAVTNSVSNLCAGIYSVTIWDNGSDSTTISFVIADSSSTYSNNPYPNGPINDTLYTDLVTNCMIDYNAIDSAALYQAVYNSSTQSLYVTWAVYSPTDTVYIGDTLALIGNPGYYNLTISVYCPNKSGNDFFKIEQVVYFDGSQVWMSTLSVDEHLLDNISIYPNPFTHSISVDSKDGIIRSMKLVDLNGRILSEMSHLKSGVVELNGLEHLSSGSYFVVLFGENASKTVKVIK